MQSEMTRVGESLSPGATTHLRTTAFVIAVTALCCACVTFSSLHRYGNADVIVPVLVSTQLWSPFYWGSNRFGMLVPLLATPFHNPFVNLAAQSLMNSFFGIAAFFLIARLVYARDYWPAIGAASGASFVWLYPNSQLVSYLIAQPYGPAFALCCVGLCLIEDDARRTRATRVASTAVGSAFVLLGSWVSPSPFLTLVPIVFLTWLSPQFTAVYRRLREVVHGPRRRDLAYEAVREVFGSRSFQMIAILTAGFLCSYVATRLSVHHLDYPPLPYREWPDGWWRLFGNFSQAVFPSWRTASLLLLWLVIGLCSYLLRRRAGTLALALNASAAILAAVACELLIMGSLAHVKENGSAARYMTASLVLVITLIVGVGLTMLLDEGRRLGIGWANMAALAGLVLVTLFRFGLPSVVEMREVLNEKWGGYTQDVIEARCSHFAGDYWKVWPTVFHVNWTLYEHGNSKRIWGISHRSRDTLHLWMRESEEAYRIGAAFDDDQAEALLARLFPLCKRVKSQQLDNISVYELRNCPNLNVPVRLQKDSFRIAKECSTDAEDTLAVCRSAGGKPGTVIYGPYALLLRGTYVLGIRGNARNIDQGREVLAVADICRDMGKVVPRKREIRRSDVSNDEFSIAIRFEVRSITDTWEFRIHFLPVSDLTVKEMTLTMVSRDSAAPASGKCAADLVRRLHHDNQAIDTPALVSGR